MFDDGDHSRGHESRCPDRYSRPSYFGDLYGPPDVLDLYSPPGARCDDLEPLDPGADIDQHLHTVTLHDIRLLTSGEL
jgi:hypothetical protein